VYDLRNDGLGMRRVAAVSLATTIQNAAVISRLDSCQSCRSDCSYMAVLLLLILQQCNVLHCDYHSRAW